MGESIRQIVEAALRLPERERALVVEELLSSLSDEIEPEVEWAEELKRRRAEFDRSPKGSISWEELKEMD